MQQPESKLRCPHVTSSRTSLRKELQGSKYSDEYRRLAGLFIRHEAPFAFEEAAAVIANNFRLFNRSKEAIQEVWNHSLAAALRPLILEHLLTAKLENPQEATAYKKALTTLHKDAPKVLYDRLQKARSALIEDDSHPEYGAIGQLSPRTWLPPRLQPIIAEFGLFNLIPSFALSAFNQMREVERQEFPRESWPRHAVDILHANISGITFHHHHQEESPQFTVHCLGKHLASSTIAVLSLNASLVMLHYLPPDLTILNPGKESIHSVSDIIDGYLSRTKSVN